MRVALVGCGNIAARYATRIVASPGLTLVGATDVATERAAALVAEFGGAAYTSLEALLADETVDTVVNLTVPEAHATVTAASLEAGKHVHTEKPMAFSYAEAQELCALARRNDRRLSCAPTTLLGEAQQTAWKLVREGILGTIRAVYAEANWGRIETWHPSPVSIYASGPLFDVGIYPLTIVTAMLGPARRVLAYGTALEPDRVTLEGRGFRLETPDFAVALIELASGVVVRLTATFWVGPGKQRGLELHGETASLYLETWLEFDSVLELSADGKAFTPVPPVREPFHGIDWGAAVVDLALAITEGRPHRASAEHAAHVVELLSAVTASIEEGGAVEVRSSFVPPEPLEWAR
jgi:predicted dehydrogenase